MKILWVEDQQEDYRAFYRRMCSCGEVMSAESVQEAIIILRSLSFDRIVLDMLIPLGVGPDVDDLERLSYNGVYVAREARRKGGLSARARIIGLSNFLDQVNVSEFGGLDVEFHSKSMYLAKLEEILQ